MNKTKNIMVRKRHPINERRILRNMKFKKTKGTYRTSTKNMIRFRFEFPETLAISFHKYKFATNKRNHKYNDQVETQSYLNKGNSFKEH
ncbi:hypothetical protein WA026_008728 [Henosepilachna vigintioctopunctata]|uniref:Uncharacterized protein n=1 Tax=Henosepilachna vigintioctopunctata TaxID=420089 RepID=A0AAW1VD87_9CUCU